MRRRYAIAVLLVIAGGAGFLLLRHVPAPEPVYAGKPLSNWFESGFEPASVALREIGPEAVPFIFAKLKREHPTSSWRAKYHKLWAQMPPLVRPVLPRPKPATFDEWSAVHSLWIIGPPAVPALAKGLKDRATEVRLSSAWALGMLRQQGVQTRAALPALVADLDDKSPPVRGRSAWALAQKKDNMEPESEAAIKPLTRLLEDRGSAEIRPWAARALGRFGALAAPAVPQLNLLLTDPEEAARIEAAVALWRIDHQNRIPLDMFMKLTGEDSNAARRELIVALGEMGPQARSAVPRLLEKLEGNFSSASESMHQALKKIDPEAAARASRETP